MSSFWSDDESLQDSWNPRSRLWSTSPGLYDNNIRSGWESDSEDEDYSPGTLNESEPYFYGTQNVDLPLSSASRSAKCPICTKTYPSEISLLNHLKDEDWGCFQSVKNMFDVNSNECFKCGRTNFVSSSKYSKLYSLVHHVHNCSGTLHLRGVNKNILAQPNLDVIRISMVVHETVPRFKMPHPPPPPLIRDLPTLETSEGISHVREPQDFPETEEFLFPPSEISEMSYSLLDNISSTSSETEEDSSFEEVYQPSEIIFRQKEFLGGKVPSEFELAYRCKHCTQCGDRVFSTVKDGLRHLQESHNVTRCPRCFERVSLLNGEYMKHRLAHFPKGTLEQRSYMDCVYCGQQFHHESLWNHIDEKHLSIQQDQFNIDDQLENSVSRPISSQTQTVEHYSASAPTVNGALNICSCRQGEVTCPTCGVSKPNELSTQEGFPIGPIRHSFSPEKTKALVKAFVGNPNAPWLFRARELEKVLGCDSKIITNWFASTRSTIMKGGTPRWAKDGNGIPIYHWTKEDKTLNIYRMPDSVRELLLNNKEGTVHEKGKWQKMGGIKENYRHYSYTETCASHPKVVRPTHKEKQKDVPSKNPKQNGKVPLADASEKVSPAPLRNEVRHSLERHFDDITSSSSGNQNFEKITENQKRKSADEHEKEKKLKKSKYDENTCDYVKINKKHYRQSENGMPPINNKTRKKIEDFKREGESKSLRNKANTCNSKSTYRTELTEENYADRTDGKISTKWSGMLTLIDMFNPPVTLTDVNVGEGESTNSRNKANASNFKSGTEGNHADNTDGKISLKWSGILTLIDMFNPPPGTREDVNLGDISSEPETNFNCIIAQEAQMSISDARFLTSDELNKTSKTTTKKSLETFRRNSLTSNATAAHVDNDVAKKRPSDIHIWDKPQKIPKTSRDCNENLDDVPMENSSKNKQDSSNKSSRDVFSKKAISIGSITISTASSSNDTTMAYAANPVLPRRDSGNTSLKRSLSKSSDLANDNDATHNNAMGMPTVTIMPPNPASNLTKESGRSTKCISPLPLKQRRRSCPQFGPNIKKTTEYGENTSVRQPLETTIHPSSLPDGKSRRRRASEKHDVVPHYVVAKLRKIKDDREVMKAQQGSSISQGL